MGGRLVLRWGRGLRRRRRRRALFERHPVATIAAAVAMMRPRVREVAIEYLLLLGRQHATNLADSTPEQLMAPMVKILPRLHHFDPRIAQDVADAAALGRRQFARDPFARSTRLPALAGNDTDTPAC